MGGLIGALIWAGVVIATNYEIGWIAIGVGVLCGIGAVVGSRGEGGMFPAAIAVMLTLVSIVGGKYFAHGYLVDQALAEFEAEQTPLGEMSAAELEDWFGVDYADEILETRLADPDITTELRAEYEEMMALGMSLDDYAEDIAKEARDRWAGVGEEERRDMIVQAERDMEAGQEAFRAYLMGDGFADAFGYMDLLFFGIAIMAAFKVGMGGDE